MLVSLRTRSESWSLNPRIYLRVILGLIIPGLVLSTTLLALFGYATWNVVSRRYLDRVSFRLLTYALVAHLVFGVSFATSSLAGYQDWRCSLMSFLTSLSVMFSSCIFFCMALNVPLVVVYKISGQAMEKYYVAGTTLISLICMVPPYASGNLGWDSVSKTCWFNGADPAARFRWVLGTQISWIIMAVGEIGAFLIIVGYLVTHELHLLWRPAHTYSSEGAGSTILKFRNIILRIGLYPLTSCLLSITTVGINMHEYKMEGIKMTKLYVRFNELCNTTLTHCQLRAAIAISAGRPLIYGLLAATDPSFIHALQALRHPDTETETQLCRCSGCLSTIVETPPETSFDDGEALDNDHVPQECMRRRESSAAPNSDLEVGKRSQFYFRHSMSGATASLSMCKPASNSPAVDVVSHI
ncbi:hypothetical protein DFH08DRAFT_895903 [Mycena albidolilacea]|uniref:G-protein coupled receptors family 2 profile 2 domain-containing protein n=1 Tax=Mycena albidolilacea TaxID=1033008 RepID=A0AAD6ZAP0_9AGAR|nr:hypothetical protein DFH08DRAFT_895903 [Mycena albidolilacea]